MWSQCWHGWSGIDCRPSDWPVGNFDCGLKLSCSGLGWDPLSGGHHTDICGSSILIGQQGSTDMCVRESTYADAFSLCEELGSRLCTVSELVSGEGNPHACGYESVYAWSWATPGGGVAECSGGKRLGVAGRPAEWFSFVPTASNIFHEVRLLAEEDGGGFSSSIAVDIYDGYGDRVLSLPPPTLHSGRHGAMLRWNTSDAGSGPFFVRAVANARHTVVVAAPVPYVVLVGTLPARQTAAQQLSIDRGAAEAVRLPFPFQFYGVEYLQIWVSASGYISFMQVSGSFADVGSIHSAIIACSASFEAAEVTVAQTQTELHVRWRGSMFQASAERSDVSLLLQSNGSLVIDWAKINLPSGGSLATGMAIWLLSGSVHNTSLNESVQICDESESGLAATVILSAEDGSAQIVRIDATRYFGVSDTVRQYASASLSPGEAAAVEGRVRLVDGTSDNNGRLEIFHNGEWGTVCDDIVQADGNVNLDTARQALAAVICHELGFGGGEEYDATGGSGRIWVDGTQDYVQGCEGNEDRLVQCPRISFANNCGHSEDVGIRCYGLNARTTSSSLMSCDADICVGHQAASISDVVGQESANCGDVTSGADWEIVVTTAATLGLVDLSSCAPLERFCYNEQYGPGIRASCAQTCGLCAARKKGTKTIPNGFLVAISVEAGSTFAEARLHCKAHYTDLASIHNADELQRVSEVCGHLTDGNNKSTGACFIGLHTNADGTWEWSDASNTDWVMTSIAANRTGSWVGLGQLESETSEGASAWHFHDVKEHAVAFLCEDRAKNGVSLVGDASMRLPPMILGGATVSLSTWVKMGGDEHGLALFSSSQNAECGYTLLCKNAVGTQLGAHGWLAIGSENGKNLFVAGVVFDSAMADEFFVPTYNRWVLLTFSFIERAVHVYVNGAAVGVGTLGADLPRMLRSENAVGGALGSEPLSRLSRLAAADIRVFDRSLSSMEAAALHTNPSDECCISAGLISAFGVGSVDLSAEVTAAVGHPRSVSVHPEMPESNDTATASHQPCRGRAAAAVREADICGDDSAIEDLVGTVSDGIGPHGPSADCRLHLKCYRGGTYTLSFVQFDTADNHDRLQVFDGSSGDAPLLGSFSGSELPSTLALTGPDLYLVFSSDAEGQAPGFRAAFACSGDRVEYLKPSNVATSLAMVRLYL